MKGASRTKRAQPRRRPRSRKSQPAAARLGSWTTALTEARAAARHAGEAAAALGRLVPELEALKASAADVARGEVARRLLDGPDGGPLTLLRRLVSATDPADASAAAVARLAVERLEATLPEAKVP